ncbi:MAG: sugar ABC transporter ATP-binding protein [Alphaproteobacteria bacterium]|nr:sugar ABC transporter ATP-binding protein [Alphaproteobacteria bacterium]
MNSVLTITGLSKSFPGVRALDRCSLDLRAGEVHALMGENGAGKSTLMKILAGVYSKDEGEIRLNGQPCEITSPKVAQSLGIGIIHQELNLMDHLTVAQNIFIGRESRKFGGLFIDESTMNQRASAIFATLKMKLEPTAEVGSLTVAAQQLVEIAKALSFDSKILIMDEPTAALNDKEIAELFAIIRHLKSRGTTMVYISHRMDELRQISDRVTVMRDGKTIGTVTMAETSLPEIIQMMVGRPLELEQHQHQDRPRPEEILLEVKNLNRGKRIQNVSLSLNRGEILGFAGLMGAGRTEVARALFGADPIESGEIRVKGRLCRIKSPKDAVEAGIGYLSENRKQFGLTLGLDVESNVTLTTVERHLWLKLFLRRLRLHTTAEKQVQSLQIKTPALSQLVRNLSGGNQQKIVIAKWLLRDCDILIFDEPTRGIDVGAKQEIYRLIRQLAEAGKGIIMISSELPEVLLLCKRIVVFCEGRLTGELLRSEANQENIMRLATSRETNDTHQP